MKLIHWDPLRDLSARTWAPAVDIFETEAAVTVLADMPGVRADGLVIDLRENVLTIEGRIDDDGTGRGRVVLQEYETGSFRREFRLTNLIDQDRIDARVTVRFVAGARVRNPSRRRGLLDAPGQLR